jgi:hypothetical protein
VQNTTGPAATSLTITAGTSVKFAATCSQLRQRWGDFLDESKVLSALSAVTLLPLTATASYPASIIAIQQQPDVAGDAFAMGMDT